MWHTRTPTPIFPPSFDKIALIDYVISQKATCEPQQQVASFGAPGVSRIGEPHAVHPVDTIKAVDDAHASPPGAQDATNVTRASDNEHGIAAGLIGVMSNLDTTPDKPSFKLKPETGHTANPVGAWNNANLGHVRNYTCGRMANYGILNAEITSRRHTCSSPSKA